MNFSSVDTKDRCKELAKSKGRSLAKEIEFLLTRELEGGE